MPWNTSAIGAYFQAEAQGIELAAVRAMETTIEEAVLKMREFIKAATTETGDARASGVSSGPRDAGLGEAGRIETKNMYDAVDSEILTDGNLSREEISTIWGKFGWINDFEDYFSYQEDGTSRVKAMHALLDAFIWAEEDLDGKILGVAGER